MPTTKIDLAQVQFPATTNDLLSGDGTGVSIGTGLDLTGGVLSNSTMAQLRAGVIVPGSFSGSPKVATVVFSTPYSSTNYALTLSVTTDGTKTFSLSIKNKTVSGFDLVLNSNNVANLIEVGWQAMASV